MPRVRSIAASIAVIGALALLIPCNVAAQSPGGASVISPDAPGEVLYAEGLHAEHLLGDYDRALRFYVAALADEDLAAPLRISARFGRARSLIRAKEFDLGYQELRALEARRDLPPGLYAQVAEELAKLPTAHQAHLLPDTAALLVEASQPEIVLRRVNELFEAIGGDRLQGQGLFELLETETLFPGQGWAGSAALAWVPVEESTAGQDGAARRGNATELRPLILVSVNRAADLMALRLLLLPRAHEPIDGAPQFHLLDVPSISELVGSGAIDLLEQVAASYVPAALQGLVRTDELTPSKPLYIAVHQDLLVVAPTLDIGRAVFGRLEPEAIGRGDTLEALIEFERPQVRFSPGALYAFMRVEPILPTLRLWLRETFDVRSEFAVTQMLTPVDRIHTVVTLRPEQLELEAYVYYPSRRSPFSRLAPGESVDEAWCQAWLPREVEHALVVRSDADGSQLHALREILALRAALHMSDIATIGQDPAQRVGRPFFNVIAGLERIDRTFGNDFLADLGRRLEHVGLVWLTESAPSDWLLLLDLSTPEHAEAIVARLNAASTRDELETAADPFAMTAAAIAARDAAISAGGTLELGGTIGTLSWVRVGQTLVLGPNLQSVERLLSERGTLWRLPADRPSSLVWRGRLMQPQANGSNSDPRTRSQAMSTAQVRITGSALELHLTLPDPEQSVAPLVESLLDNDALRTPPPNPIPAFLP